MIWILCVVLQKIGVSFTAGVSPCAFFGIAMCLCTTGVTGTVGAGSVESLEWQTVYKDVLKPGTSQMMENRLPDARELSYQHLMAGSVKQTFKASRSWS